MLFPTYAYYLLFRTLLNCLQNMIDTLSTHSICDTRIVKVGCWQQLLKIIWMLVGTYNKKHDIHGVASSDLCFCLTAQIPRQIFHQLPRNDLWDLPSPTQLPLRAPDDFCHLTPSWTPIGGWLPALLWDKQCSRRNGEIKIITTVNLIFFHCTSYNAIDSEMRYWTTVCLGSWHNFYVLPEDKIM